MPPRHLVMLFTRTPLYTSTWDWLQHKVGFCVQSSGEFPCCTIDYSNGNHEGTITPCCADLCRPAFLFSSHTLSAFVDGGDGNEVWQRIVSVATKPNSRLTVVWNTICELYGCIRESWFSRRGYQFHGRGDAGRSGAANHLLNGRVCFRQFANPNVYWDLCALHN